MERESAEERKKSSVLVPLMKLFSAFRIRALIFFAEAFQIVSWSHLVQKKTLTHLMASSSPSPTLAFVLLPEWSL